MGQGRSGIAFACVLAIALTQVGVAAADPTNSSDPLLYTLTDCSDGSSFQAFKQRSEGAALFLVDGSGVFVAMKAVSDRDQFAPDGTFIPKETVFFETPGFSGPNNQPTITCTNFSPLSQTWSSLTGYIAPTK
jgi:hypothetical protein